MLFDDVRVGQSFFEGTIEVFSVGVTGAFPDGDSGVMGLEGLISRHF